MSKSFLRISVLLAFLLAALTSAVLLPAYRLVGTDFVLRATLLYDLVDLLWQWSETFLLGLLVTLTVLGVHQAGITGARPLYVICGGALLFKYFAAIIAYAIIEGSLDLSVNYGTTAFALMLELLMLAAVAYLTHRMTSARNEQARTKKKAAKRLNTQIEAEKPLLPLASLFGKGNPLQNALYLGIGTVALLRFLSFIASEIAFSMQGVPFTWADLPITLLYLLLTVLLPAFLAYLGAYFLCNTLSAQHFKAE